MKGQKAVSFFLAFLLIFTLFSTTSYTVSATSVSPDDFVDFALQNCVGVPYVSAGRTTSGFDCCGLVWYVCNHFGIDIGNGTQREQINYGIPVNYSLSSYDSVVANLQKGDLIFFDYDNTPPVSSSSDHVAIYVGNGQILQAHTYGTNSRVDNLTGGWIKDSNDVWISEWKLICGIRRVLDTGSTPPSPSDDSLSLYSYNYPTSLNVGEAFSIYGTVSSGYSNITSLTVGVYNSSGSLETGKTVYPNSRTYSIANVDNYVLFNTLSAGTHYYRISATNASGTKQLLNKQFSVVGTPAVEVVRMVDCYRKIQLPARVINLYWNPTDTSRASYFSYGPYLSCPTYAEMSDGSIMYGSARLGYYCIVGDGGYDYRGTWKLISKQNQTYVIELSVIGGIATELTPDDQIIYAQNEYCFEMTLSRYEDGLFVEQTGCDLPAIDCFEKYRIYSPEKESEFLDDFFNQEN